MAANRERGEVDLVSDGKSYILVVDVDAMCAVEEKLSTPERMVTFVDVVNQILRTNVRYIRTFIWGALQRHHPDVDTVQKASRIIDGAGGLPGLAKQIEALAASTQPDPEDRAAKTDRPTGAARTKTRAGTGGNSTAKRAKSV